MRINDPDKILSYVSFPITWWQFSTNIYIYLTKSKSKSPRHHTHHQHNGRRNTHCRGFCISPLWAWIQRYMKRFVTTRAFICTYGIYTHLYQICPPLNRHSTSVPFSSGVSTKSIMAYTQVIGKVRHLWQPRRGKDCTVWPNPGGFICY